MTYNHDFRVYLSTASDSAPREADPTVVKLRAFSRLTAGWSYGQGRAIGGPVLLKAERLLDFATQLGVKADVFPGTDGDVAVAFYRDDLCVQVNVNQDSSLGLRVERGIGFNYEDVIEPIERTNESTVYRSLLAQLSPEPWTPSVSSTSRISTHSASVF